MEENHLEEPQKQHQQQQGKHQEGLSEGENPSADRGGFITLMSVEGWGKWDFEPPPYPMNPRREVIYPCFGLRIFVWDLKVFWNGESW